ncbi:MAG: FUSC family protein, partial [Verrucomicrobia bacterium]|nr:FUSC family protein [Verrucomicrobiota bacterium]
MSRSFHSIEPVAPSVLHRAWNAFLELHFETESKDFGWIEGLRAAVGITVPAIAGLLANHLSLGVLGSFAVVWILSCDLGGSYRQKANDLSAAGIVILFAYLFSGLMIGSVWRYIAGVFLWVFAGAVIGVAGSAAAQAGLVSSTIVITSVVLIVPSEFWIRFLICVFGIFWAIILSIALWPIRAHSPVFTAAGKCLARLGSMSESFWIGAATVRRPARNLDFALAYDRLVTSINQARQMWGMVRARRGGPTTRGILLLSIIEMIDDIARTLVTLREVINLIGEQVWFEPVRGKLTELTDSLSITFARAASAFARRGGLVDVGIVQETFREFERFAAADTDFRHAYQENELLQTGRHLVNQVAELARMIHELGSPSPQVEPPPEARFGPKPRSYNFFAEVRSGLSFRSSSFQHALRLGMATAFASLLASTVHLTRGYWIPMTVVLVLKPNFGGTLQRSVQRVTGTVLGAIVASILLVSL